MVVSTTNLPDDCAGSMMNRLTSDGSWVAGGGVEVGAVVEVVELDDEVEVVACVCWVGAVVAPATALVADAVGRGVWTGVGRSGALVARPGSSSWKRNRYPPTTASTSTPTIPARMSQIRRDLR
jgi:hypothetical protein